MYSTDLQCGEHLALLFTVEQAILILHRDEGREVVRDRVVWVFHERIETVSTAIGTDSARGRDDRKRRTLHLVELVGVAGTHANVADVSSLNDIVQSLHCLLYGRIRVKSVAYYANMS